MTIGEKIKSLRREQGVTQEKLADYLGISYQSVSKWELGTANPDVSLVVPLAAFFGITTDELLDADEAKRGAELKEYEREYMRIGPIEALDQSRAMAKKYPKNFSIQVSIATGLVTKFWREADAENSEGNVDELREAETILLRILNDCVDEGARGNAYQYLMYIYTERNTPLFDPEKAIAVAMKAPSVFSVSSEKLLFGAYSASPKPEHKEKAREMYSGVVLSALFTLENNLVSQFTPDPIFAYETLLKIYDAIIYDGNYLYHHASLCNIHFYMSHIYCNRGERESALASLRRAVHHAREYDNLPREETKFTSVFLAGAVGVPDNNESPWKLRDIQSKFREFQGFEPYREDPEFTAALA
ncbi:MAG: helix-turn-helix domain-containing protein [Oscillospiraceae bacterium]|jgi:transcriptional regulator with XRE-family HTH domain|nr:helix-turn-helix domain-containing protein [Oscillospiraceae bacterium]